MNGPASTPCPIYIVASRELSEREPYGECRVCRRPYAKHEKRVSKLVPHNQIMVINEEALRLDHAHR